MDYRQYLQSPEWRAVRRRVMGRARGWCERCRKAKALQVHHLTYARLGHERLTDLQAVCQSCHQAAHPNKVLPASFTTRVACKHCRDTQAEVFVGDDVRHFLCGACGNSWSEAWKASTAKPPRPRKQKPQPNRQWASAEKKARREMKEAGARFGEKTKPRFGAF